MPQCGYVEHGLENFSFYDQKHMAHLAACSGPPADSRRVARGARISETRLLSGWYQNMLYVLLTINQQLDMEECMNFMRKQIYSLCE